MKSQFHATCYAASPYLLDLESESWRTTANRYRVYQLVYQLRQDFEAGAACKSDTCKALGFPAFPTTNQKVGSSNLSGRATFPNKNAVSQPAPPSKARQLDLGLPNPEQELLKAQLTLQIYTILKDSGMRQVEIAKILGVRQPQVSLLMRNRAGNFSVGRLMEFLTALRQDVEIIVRPANKEHGVLSVVSA